MTALPTVELREGVTAMLDPSRVDLMSSPEGQILNGVHQLTGKLHERDRQLSNARSEQDRLRTALDKGGIALESARTSMRRWRTAAFTLAVLLVAESAWLGWALVYSGR